MVGDSSTYVRETALKALQKCSIEPKETERLEAMLTRKAGDLRRGVIGLLAGQPDARALESAGRLLASANVDQRAAGLGVLRRFESVNRSSVKCHEGAAPFRSRGLRRSE